MTGEYSAVELSIPQTQSKGACGRHCAQGWWVSEGLGLGPAHPGPSPPIFSTSQQDLPFISEIRTASIFQVPMCLWADAPQPFPNRGISSPDRNPIPSFMMANALPVSLATCSLNFQRNWIRSNTRYSPVLSPPTHSLCIHTRPCCKQQHGALPGQHQNSNTARCGLKWWLVACVINPCQDTFRVFFAAVFVCGY